MSKRPASPDEGAELAGDVSAGARTAGRRGGQPLAKTDVKPSEVVRTGQDGEGGEDGGMGEFEDPFEDELESEEEEDDDDDLDEEIIDAEEDEDDQEDMNGEDVEIDGVKLSGKIKRIPDDEEDSAMADAAQAYIPGAHGPLEEGQHLEPDQSAYDFLHRLNVTWPCLSFDLLKDHLGNDRQSFPHTAYLVAGTQADTAKNNELMVMKASQLHRTQHDDDSDGEDDDDDDGLDEDAILEYRSIPHVGGINRVRAAPAATPTSDLEPCLDPYPVAVWSELGKVGIWDVRPLFNALDRPGSSAAALDRRKINTPLHVVEAHRGVEGYAMDWAGSSSGTGAASTGRASSLRLLTGDVHSKIFLTTSSNAGFTTHANPFTSHTSSVEDLQWSPSEPTVFASCSADRTIRVWDVRVKSRKSVLVVEEAHEQDVNVISWNRTTEYLLLSGGDEGGLNVWDMRNFKAGPAGSAAAGAGGKIRPEPVAAFRWHTRPISSVEWHPTDDSVFAASGRDDQVSLWDLSVEVDDEEIQQQKMQAGGRILGPDGREIPSQLLFCHHGASEIKEVHWHPQISGMLVSTSADGFHLFKTISV